MKAVGFLYLFLNIFTISVPLARSFESNIAYYRKWDALFPAMIITATFFILWDIFFTPIGVWSFNGAYLTGFYLFNLPIEEWMFFFTIPFACVFSYEVYHYFVKRDYLGDAAIPVTIGLGIALFLAALMHHDRIYTFVNFGLTSVFLLVLGIWLRPKFLGNFYITYLISLLPFVLVNGILTGSFIENQVVWYNPDEIIGTRIFTIPLEDTVYSLLLLLMNISLYEFFKQKMKLV
jgi:lycopene cyclase domain-containing protein